LALTRNRAATSEGVRSSRFSLVSSISASLQTTTAPVAENGSIRVARCVTQLVPVFSRSANATPEAVQVEPPGRPDMRTATLSGRAPARAPRTSNRRDIEAWLWAAL
jgi:hypothetical protein